MLTFYKIFLLAITHFFMFSAIQAHADKNDKKSRSAPKVLSMTVYKPVTRATEYLQQENYDSALGTLEAILERRKRITDYDIAKINQLLMSVYIGKNNYSAAAVAGEKAATLNALAREEQIFLHSRLFYLYFSMQQQDSAITYLNTWFAMDPEPNINAIFSAAQLYAGADDNQKALEYANMGFSRARATDGLQLKESWYQLIISIFFRMGHYAEARDFLQEAISLWPSKSGYFIQLSAVYQELHNEKAAFAMMSIAYGNELLGDEADILRLVHHYRYHDYPSQGAAILKKSIDSERVKANEENWRSLSQAWMQARDWNHAERALINAAALSTSGENWMQLCQIAFQDERWREAQDFCQKAIQLGELDKQESTTWYLLALAQFYDHKLLKARENFDRCSQWVDTKDNCTYWKNRINQTKNL